MLHHYQMKLGTAIVWLATLDSNPVHCYTCRYWTKNYTLNLLTNSGHKR